MTIKQHAISFVVNLCVFVILYGVNPSPSVWWIVGYAIGMLTAMFVWGDNNCLKGDSK